MKPCHRFIVVVALGMVLPISLPAAVRSEEALTSAGEQHPAEQYAAEQEVSPANAASPASMETGAWGCALSRGGIITVVIGICAATAGIGCLPAAAGGVVAWFVAQTKACQSHAGATTTGPTAMYEAQ